MSFNDPTTPLENHTPVVGVEQDSEYNVTELNNGFTVLTETSKFPGAVHFGFMMNVGTRDETAETSGALMAIKNTYLKTLKHTNETVNYGMTQMSGGEFKMDFDQETTYFRGHCIEYDVSDMFQMMVDCALEPKSVLSANVAKAKNRKTQALKEHLSKFDPWAYENDLLLRTAYGYNTLGMPYYGLEGNVESIDARMLQNFVIDNITPKKCLIVANGVHNHNEFVSLAKERLGELLPVPEHQYERSTSEYIGGEFRNWTETPNTSITVAFEGAKWTDANQPVFQVMSELLGSTNGPSLNRAVQNLAKEHSFVDEAHTVNSHFTDSGLFGLTVRGPGSHSRELMDVLLGELNGLKTNITEEELNRAKNHLKVQILSDMDCGRRRLEEVARNYMTFGELNFDKYCEKIDSVTAEDINTVSTASNLLGC